MAQNVAVVRANLTATGAGTTDFTSAGFGTPTAAIIVACAANSTNNPQDGATLSIGFWDGTNQRTIGVLAADGAATTNTFRISDDSYGVLPLSAAGLTNAYTISAVTDGIRLTLSVDNTVVERYATVILLSGVSAKALTFTPNATQNSTTESASLGFAPKLIFFTTIGDTSADVAVEAVCIMSFGVAAVDGTHRMIGFGSVTAVADEVATIKYSETRCVGQVYNDATSTTWAGEVTTFGTDTFTMTTRDAATGSDVCFALALGGADLSYDLGTLTTPTSTGVQSTATDIAPDAILAMLSTATSTTLETGSGANGLMVGMADDTNEYSHTIYVEDGAATTNTGSVASAVNFINLDSSSGGSRTDLCVGTVTMDTDSFDIDFTTVDATARKGWWVAFGAAAAGGFQAAWARSANSIIQGARI